MFVCFKFTWVHCTVNYATQCLHKAFIDSSNACSGVFDNALKILVFIFLRKRLQMVLHGVFLEILVLLKPLITTFPEGKRSNSFSKSYSFSNLFNSSLFEPTV